MSYKVVILLTRSADMTHEQFATWWLEEHAPLARQLPKLRRGVFNLVELPDDGAPDGVSELWFDSQADLDAAYASEIGQRVVADSMSHVAGRQRLAVVEHDVSS